jgi:tRNA(Ile)-lysidine synthase
VSPRSGSHASRDVVSTARLSPSAYSVLGRARDAIAEHGMLAAGDTVVVAVSGGPDSTCLLDVLGRLPLELTLVVAHVDHGLAGDSAEVAAGVARRGADLGYEVHVVEAPELAGPNLQARARAFRYGFLDTVARRVGAGRVATGHTLDDRVETTLARLIHGAGTEGLAGIPAAEAGRVRPLIGVRRAESRAYCEELAIAFYDDPANDDLSFERVAVRRRLVAAIERHWGEGAVRAVAASAQRLRDDADALSALADRVYSGMATPGRGDVALDRPALAALPRALRRRVLDRAVGRVRDRSGGIEAALAALDNDGATTRRFAVASGIEIALEPGVVRVTGVGEAPT